jgi:hypothetical protein
MNSKIVFIVSVLIVLAVEWKFFAALGYAIMWSL